jgi:Domain of unknown function (DUF4258)
VLTYNFYMSRKPTKNQWETLIRHLAAESGNVFFTRHALARMRQRQITRLQVLEVLQRGVIRREPEPDMKTDHTQCRMERVVTGRSIGVVLALESPDAVSGIVVTALLIGD